MKRRSYEAVIPLLLAWYIYSAPPLIHIGQTPKYVHISFDDVIICYEDLCNKEKKYESIFNQPFLGYLWHLHRKYGYHFTLYSFNRGSNNFNIAELPIRYKREFAKNGTWLKISFHGCKFGQPPKDCNLQDFQKSIESVSFTAGKAWEGEIIRLDYFQGNKDEISYLNQHYNTHIMLTSDDNRQCYDLTETENLHLQQEGAIIKNNVKYLRTHIRIENIQSPYFNLYRNNNKDTLIIFTHEWQLDRITKYKLERLLILLKQNHYQNLK